MRSNHRKVAIAANEKYWEIIAAHLGKTGWTWGCSSQIDSTGRVLFTADAHRSDRKRFIVRADEKLTAFLELERITSDDSTKKVRFSTGPREGPR